MKPYFVIISIATGLTVAVVISWPPAQTKDPAPKQRYHPGLALAAALDPKTDVKENAPAFVSEIPPGYRDWRLISVAREEGTLDDIRAVLGNDLAIKAYREGTRPFPDGTIIARLAWSFLPSEENNKTFGRAQSFIAGPPKNGVQFMIKDSKKYAATGGWGYGQFDDGKPADPGMLTSCFPCHQAFQEHDFIFTHYAR